VSASKWDFGFFLLLGPGLENSLFPWVRLVLASRLEGLEAIAPDLVLNGETGYVHSAGDTEALARGVRQYMTTPLLSDRQGRAALELVPQHSSLESAVSRMLRALHKVKEGACPSRGECP
jgi:hypothetical protein